MSPGQRGALVMRAREDGLRVSARVETAHDFRLAVEMWGLNTGRTIFPDRKPGHLAPGSDATPSGPAPVSGKAPVPA